MKSIYRFVAHAIFRTRSFNNRCLKVFAKEIRDKKILELGSGKLVNGRDSYSGRKFFDESNDFTQSDINPSFGHEVVNVVNMDFESEYDIILCMNVLEHVYDFDKAIANIHKALRPGGQAAVFVPTFYPLHDEPHDYWRFTEHALRRMFSDFQIVDLRHSGVRAYAFAYFMIVQKTQ